MRFTIALMALASGSLPVAVHAQAAKAWPREVQAVYDQFKGQCQRGGKFVPDRENFAHEVEVTGDGKPDWVVEVASLGCVVPQAVRDSGEGPEDGNSYCGTAGCSVQIFGSGKKGLTSIFNGTLRSWDVIDLGRGRKGLETSVHGTACGGTGAEVCIETLAWNGRKWDVVKRYRWTDADYEAHQKEQAATPYQEPPRHEAKWSFGGKGAGAVAATTGHPDFMALGLRCQPGGGVYMTLVPKPGMPLPPAGQPLLLHFTGSENGGYAATQTLVQEPGKPDLSGPLDPGVEVLLEGADTGLELIASNSGGDEWRQLDYMTLAGSTAAIRSLKQQCAASAGSTAATQAAGQKPAAPLGIMAGYYVLESEACSNPEFEAIFYDGKRLGLMRGGGAPGSSEENFIGPLGKVEKSRGYFLLPAWGMEVKILSSTRIQLTIQDTEAPRRWCPADQIPAKWRMR
ncbi:hypothetical protein [Sphingopyxis sp.]|uniref:hypothetical protein n=1 Tax=Sphingopyxis sp. TaxID=1908224 RepID=UPI0035AEE62D